MTNCPLSPADFVAYYLAPIGARQCSACTSLPLLISFVSSSFSLLLLFFLHRLFLPFLLLSLVASSFRIGFLSFFGLFSSSSSFAFFLSLVFLSFSLRFRGFLFD